MSHYGMAVCEEGHVVSSIVSAGEKVDKFCEECMTPVHTKCANCGEGLRGRSRTTFYTGNISVPNGCRECGQPYPWTKRRLEKAKMAIEQHAAEHGMAQDETAALKIFAEDVVTGSATEAQVNGARAAVKKFGPAGTVLWNALTDIAAKTMAAMMKP